VKYIVKSYLDCQRCGLCKFRREIVFGRGSLPAKLLFIGEAPGKTEDLLGIPFVGQVGKLFEYAMKLGASMAGLEKPPSYFLTTAIACRSIDAQNGENRQPTGDEVWACFERLQKTYSQVNPKRVVFLGEVAKHFLHKAFPSANCLRHPAYVLRKGGLESPEFRAMGRDLSAIFKGLTNASH
jgi:DNA polymerase